MTTPPLPPARPPATAKEVVACLRGNLHLIPGSDARSKEPDRKQKGAGVFSQGAFFPALSPDRAAAPARKPARRDRWLPVRAAAGKASAASSHDSAVMEALRTVLLSLSPSLALVTSHTKRTRSRLSR